MSSYYVGVDVGTSSVRAALVGAGGRVVKSDSSAISIWSPEDPLYQQSSDDIWRACCQVVKNVISGVDNGLIRGIGFDATCSLVVLDETFKPLTISPLGENDQNVIMWLDHRAAEQAKFINEKKHPLLQHYGGSISLEQNPSKILWLRQKFDSTWWSRVGHFFDLPDFLTWKATGSLTRSLCSLVCKMAYESNENGHGWNERFWTDIGLQELLENNAATLGNVVQYAGQPCGHGLQENAAQELGLKAGTAVATSLIDAHCGTIGLLSCKELLDEDAPVTSRLSLICGTSTCHMVMSEKPHFVPGVWGPLYSALLPNLWLNEGGQSATGKLVDRIIDSHPASKSIISLMKDGRHIQEELNDILTKLQQEKKLKSIAHLTADLHVWPDFHGNRSPLADPSLKGMMSGLTLSNSEEDLALIYLATIQSLAYGTRHIIDTMFESGHSLKSILICGGLSKNPIFVHMHADITGLPVIVPHESEAVLLGGAILGATAAKDFPTIFDAMKAMGGSGKVIMPHTSEKRYHEKKYAVFLKMLEHQRECRIIMESALDEIISQD